MPLPYTGGVTVTVPGGGGAAGVTLTEVTRITVNKANSNSNRPRISIAHLGSPMTQANGTAVTRFEEPYTNIWQQSGAGSGQSLDVEYIGSGTVAGGASGTLSVTGPFSLNVTNATVASCVVTGSVGDIVRRSVQVVW
jgi:hypothetical protein